MTTRVRGVVVAHDDLADALVRAVEGIAGVADALVPVSNTACTPEALEQRILDAVGKGPAIVFTDMTSGSCAFACRRALLRRSGVVIVTGVSLPMLLDFLFHREMELGPLADRVAGKARNATEVHRGADGGVG